MDEQTARTKIRHRTIRLALAMLFIVWLLGTAVEIIHPSPMAISIEPIPEQQPPSLYFQPNDGLSGGTL